jgi:hypothetical protein
VVQSAEVQQLELLMHPLLHFLYPLLQLHEQVPPAPEQIGDALVGAVQSLAVQQVVLVMQALPQTL